jgi:hypothetical protein
MKKICTLIFCSLVCSNVFSQACDSLFSPCLGTFSRNGYYFDLEAVNDITVTGFSYLAQNPGTRDMAVYYRQGTYFGYEGAAANWTLLGTQLNITPLTALNCPLPHNAADISFNVCIPQGMVYGFYLTMSSGTGTLETHSNLPEGSIGAQDVNVKLITGKGQFGIGDFAGTLTGGLTFEGAIKYDCGCTTSMMNELNKSQFSFYPNPVQSTLNFSYGNQLIKRIEVYDGWGALVLVSDESTFDVSMLAGGIYTAAVIQTNGSIKRVRFVKE